MAGLDFYSQNFKPIRSPLECVDELVQLIDTHETELCSGQLQLSLTARFLDFLDQTTQDRSTLSTQETKPKLHRLKQVFAQLPVLKITARRSTVAIPPSISLPHFVNLECLELDSLCVQWLPSLHVLASQLRRLRVYRCWSDESVEKWLIEQLHQQPWNRLSELRVSRTQLASQETVKYLPAAVHSLELSWSALSVFRLNEGPASLLSLTQLDLSYNRLRQIPCFSERTCEYIQVLRLRGNLIESLDGLQRLKNVEELDLSCNCICEKSELVYTLVQLHQLQSFDIRENPVEYEKNLEHELCQNVSNLVYLNGSPLSQRKRLLASSCIPETPRVIVNSIASPNENGHSQKLPKELQAQSQETAESEMSNKTRQASIEGHAEEEMVSEVITQDKVPLLEKSNQLTSPSAKLLNGETKRRSEIKKRIAVILDQSDSDLTESSDLNKSLPAPEPVAATSLSAVGSETSLKEIADIIAQQRLSLSRSRLKRPVSEFVVPTSTPLSVSLVERMTLENSINKPCSRNSQLISSAVKKLEAEFGKAEDSIILKSNPLSSDSENKPENGNQSLSKMPDEISRNSFITSDEHNRSEKSDSTLIQEEQKLQNQKSDDSGEISNQFFGDDEDMEGDHIFLVEKQIHSEASEPMFLIFNENAIHERHFSSAKILNQHDPASLFKAESLEDLGIRFTFSSKVRAKQEVVYRVESGEQRQRMMKQFVQPILGHNQAQQKLDNRKLYECLKCNHRNANSSTCTRCHSLALVEINQSSELATTLDFRPLNYGSFKSSFKESFLERIFEASSNVAEPCSYHSVEDDSGVTSADAAGLAQKMVTLTDNPDEINELIQKKQENYSLGQFVNVDYELKLHLDLKLFAKDEHIQHALPCSFLVNNSGDLHHGTIVFSNSCLYFISRRENKSDDNKVMFDCVHSFQLSRIKSIRLTTNEFFQQGLWLTVERLSGKKKKKKHIMETQSFFILLADQHLLQLLANYAGDYFAGRKEIKLNKQFKAYGVTENAVKLDSEEQIVFGEFIDCLVKKDETEELRSKNEHLICVLIGRSAEIFVAKCEFIANELKFQVLCRNNLIHLSTPAYLGASFGDLHLQFQKDNERNIVEWLITCYSVNSLQRLLGKIRSFWEENYMVPLQLAINANS